VNEVIDASEDLLRELGNHQAPASWELFCAGQKRIAQAIAATWKPLHALSDYFEIVDPKLAEALGRSFGPKLTFVLFLDEISQVLFDNEKNRSACVLRKLSVEGTFRRSLHLLDGTATMKEIRDLQRMGDIEVEAFDFRNVSALRNLVSVGKANVKELKEFKAHLRTFMLNNFQKEDFFFSKVP
jgi:hypothetical protein